LLSFSLDFRLLVTANSPSFPRYIFEARLSCVYENFMEKSTLYKHSGLHPKSKLHSLKYFYKRMMSMINLDIVIIFNNCFYLFSVQNDFCDVSFVSVKRIESHECKWLFDWFIVVVEIQLSIFVKVYIVDLFGQGSVQSRVPYPLLISFVNVRVCENVLCDCQGLLFKQKGWSACATFKLNGFNKNQNMSYS